MSFELVGFMWSTHNVVTIVWEVERFLVFKLGIYASLGRSASVPLAEQGRREKT